MGLFAQSRGLTVDDKKPVETKLEYVAMCNIGTNPLWKADTSPTQEQLDQIEDIRKYVYKGQIQTKTATKRKTRAKK